MPCRKGQAVQVIDCRARQDSRRDLSCGNAHCSLLRLALDEEVGVIFKKLRHMCRRSTEEADAHAISPLRFLGPFDFMTVIDKGTQDERDVPVDKLVTRHTNVVARLFENGSQIAGMNAGDVLKKSSSTFDPTRCPRKSAEPGTITTNHRVLIYKTASPFDVGDNHAHNSSLRMK